MPCCISPLVLNAHWVACIVFPATPPIACPNVLLPQSTACPKPVPKPPITSPAEFQLLALFEKSLRPCEASFSFLSAQLEAWLTESDTPEVTSFTLRLPKFCAWSQAFETPDLTSSILSLPHWRPPPTAALPPKMPL